VSIDDPFLYVDTGADGRFRIEHVPPGRWTSSINGIPGRETSAPSFRIDVKEGATTEVEWRVP